MSEQHKVAEREIEDAIRNTFGLHYKDANTRPTVVAVTLGVIEHRGGVEVPKVTVEIK